VPWNSPQNGWPLSRGGSANAQVARLIESSDGFAESRHREGFTAVNNVCELAVQRFQIVESLLDFRYCLLAAAPTSDKCPVERPSYLKGSVNRQSPADWWDSCSTTCRRHACTLAIAPGMKGSEHIASRNPVCSNPPA
jgi:hypothetical protein